MQFKNIRVMNPVNMAFQSKNVLIQNGIKEIIDATKSDEKGYFFPHENVRDWENKVTMFGGLADTHIHGFGGYDFADVGDHPEVLPQIMHAIGRTGVAYVMATLVSLRMPTLIKCLQVIDEYVQRQELNLVTGAARIIGVHLEGPFIAKNCKGAHDLGALQDDISLDQFKAIIAHAPHITEWKMTVAPDLPGMIDFAGESKALLQQGISVKIFLGHTNPDIQTIESAVQMGVDGFTHLGNACMEACCRETRKLEASDASSHLVQWVLQNPHRCPAGVELIVDGAHLSQSFVSLIKEIIGDKIVLITDALGPSGLADGIYKLGTLDIRKEGGNFYLCDADGVFAMKDGILENGKPGKVKSLAGSAASLPYCIQTYSDWTTAKETEEERWKALYFAAIKNPLSSSLSEKAQSKLPEEQNFSLFDEQGKLVMSLCNGELREHIK